MSRWHTVGMDRVAAVVVGAGAVGLAVGRALAQAGRETIVVDREPGIGRGVSSRSSEVVHSGLHYQPGSLKAALCVRGQELLYAYCADRGVGHRRCGKLTVANDDDDTRALHVLQHNAAANGVPVELLDAAEARALEPELRCITALHSPSTGIVDSHGLMLALQRDLEHSGGMVALGTELVSATLSTDRSRPHELRFADGTELGCDMLVNSASLHAPSLARRFDGLDPRCIPREWYAKGSYFTLAGRSPFSRLVYPAPTGAWLGIHFTLDLGGQAKFGPDIEWLAINAPEQIDYDVDPGRAPAFYVGVRRYWPGLPDDALAPGYGGVRPKIYGPGEPAADFRIDGPSAHGVPGLLNLFGIESPGLTSALAIAEVAAAELLA